MFTRGESVKRCCMSVGADPEGLCERKRRRHRQFVELGNRDVDFEGYSSKRLSGADPFLMGDWEPVSSEDDLTSNPDLLETISEDEFDEETCVSRSILGCENRVSLDDTSLHLQRRSEKICGVFAEKLRLWTESLDKRKSAAAECFHPDAVPNSYAFAPGASLERFLSVSENERRKAFFETVSVGDIVVGQIRRICRDHAEVDILFFESPKIREIWDLNILGHLGSANTLMGSEQDESFLNYNVGDFVRCEVLGLTISNCTVELGMLGVKTQINPAQPLGRLALEELPQYYRRSRILSESCSYESALLQNPNFNNAACTETYLRNFGLAPTTLLSFMSSAPYSSDPSMTELRDMQASRHATELLRRAVILIASGDLAEAFDCLVEATKADQKNAAAFLARAALYAKRHEYLSAIEDFRVVLSIDPNQQYAKNGLSDALAAYARDCMKKNLAFEARKAYEECLEIHPEHKEAALALRTVLSAGSDDVAQSDSHPSCMSRALDAPSKSLSGGELVGQQKAESHALVVYGRGHCEDPKQLLKITRRSDFEFVLEDFDPFTSTATFDSMCDDFQTSCWKARVGIKCYEVTFLGPPVDFYAFGTYVSEVLGGFLGKPEESSLTREKVVGQSDGAEFESVAMNSIAEQASVDEESSPTGCEQTEVSAQMITPVVETVRAVVESPCGNEEMNVLEVSSKEDEVTAVDTCGEEPKDFVRNERPDHMNNDAPDAADPSEVVNLSDVEEPFPSPSPGKQPEPISSSDAGSCAPERSEDLDDCVEEPADEAMQNEGGHGCSGGGPSLPDSQLRTESAIKRAPLRIVIPKCPKVPAVPILKGVPSQEPSSPVTVYCTSRCAVPPKEVCDSMQRKKLTRLVGKPQPTPDSSLVDCSEEDLYWRNLTEAERMNVLRNRLVEVSNEMDSCSSLEINRWMELEKRGERLHTRIHKLQLALDQRSRNARSRLPAKVRKFSKNMDILWLLVDRLRVFVSKQSAYFVTLSSERKAQWLEAAKSLDAIWTEVRDNWDRFTNQRRAELYVTTRKLVKCFGEQADAAAPTGKRRSGPASSGAGNSLKRPQ